MLSTKFSNEPGTPTLQNSSQSKYHAMNTRTVFGQEPSVGGIFYHSPEIIRLESKDCFKLAVKAHLLV